MIKRTLSTIALWGTVFGTIYFFGAIGGVVLLAIFALLAQYEFQTILEKSGLPPWRYITLMLGGAMMLAVGVNAFAMDGKVYAVTLVPIVTVVCLTFPIAVVFGALRWVSEPNAINRLAGSVLSLAYVPFMLMHYLLIMFVGSGNWLKNGTRGLCLAIWVIAAAKFTDVGGYLVGSMIGRHKLAPAISPGKTWEGVGGGLLLAALVAYLPVQFFPNYFPDWLAPEMAAFLALPIGMAAIISDLSESAFKRRAGLKDSGKCIPGIGGALDLADSLLLAGPVAFYLFLIVQKTL
jgi:phosphatidate cytidylyltransferase